MGGGSGGLEGAGPPLGAQEAAVGRRELHEAPHGVVHRPRVPDAPRRAGWTDRRSGLGTGASPTNFPSPKPTPAKYVWVLNRIPVGPHWHCLLTSCHPHFLMII